MFQAGCSTGYLKKLERKHSISPALLPAIPSMPRRLTRQKEMKRFRCIREFQVAFCRINRRPFPTADAFR